MFFIKLVSILLMAMSLVQSASFKKMASPSLFSPDSLIEAPLLNYTTVSIEWNVQIQPKLPSIAINGTVQDVVAHLAAIHPEYMATVDKTIAERETCRRRHHHRRRHSTDLVPLGTKYYCNNFENAMYEDIQAGVSYLEGLSGVPTLGPGPGTCSRVSCSWDSAIWWCNDNADVKSLNSFFDVAIGALEIMEHCTTLIDGESYTQVVNGQQFFHDGWNVIITAAVC